MLFIIRAEDKPGALARRLEVRPVHLEYLQSKKDVIKVGGAILDDKGDPMGSVLIVDVADKAAAEAFAKGDPFSTEGVFASFTVTPYRAALGEWLG
ncbi:YciI family protein [Geminicoccus roseus]|uniref:YciI family protein n=1 Tax=Geminicoccus roseus TaxID=404900 RepID=UPI00040447AB|nr:YciI family protein [Geminicoccus roseus]